MSAHKVVTKNFAENQNGGVMICGINFGYSSRDEADEMSGVASSQENPSFFSDLAVNNTRFRNRVLTWLTSWGLTFATRAGEEGCFERAFFQTNWLDTQTRSVSSDGNITTDTLVREPAGLLHLLEARKPSVVFFFGSAMIEALNDPRIREKVIAILGARSGNPRDYRARLPNYSGTQFRMRIQEFGKTFIVGLPHPQAFGVSDEYVAALRPPAEVLERLLAHCTQQGGRHVPL